MRAPERKPVGCWLRNSHSPRSHQLGFPLPSPKAIHEACNFKTWRSVKPQSLWMIWKEWPAHSPAQWKGKIRPKTVPEEEPLTGWDKHQVRLLCCSALPSSCTIHTCTSATSGTKTHKATGNADQQTAAKMVLVLTIRAPHISPIPSMKTPSKKGCGTKHFPC